MPSSDPSVGAAVLQAFPTGEIFVYNRVREMLKKYAAVLPADASERDVEIHHDVKAATVDIILDFLTCAAPANE